MLQLVPTHVTETCTGANKFERHVVLDWNKVHRLLLYRGVRAFPFFRNYTTHTILFPTLSSNPSLDPNLNTILSPANIHYERLQVQRLVQVRLRPQQTKPSRPTRLSRPPRHPTQRKRSQGRSPLRRTAVLHAVERLEQQRLPCPEVRPSRLHYR